MKKPLRPRHGAVSIRQDDNGYWYICVYNAPMVNHAGYWRRLPPLYLTRSRARQVVKDSAALRELLST